MPSLWKPMTSGEELFLNLYDDLGAKISTTGPDDIGLDFLVNGAAFESFSRIAATTEVFLRCLHNGMTTYKLTEAARPETYIRNLRFEVELPNRLLRNQRFAERLAFASRIAVEKKRSPQIENNATRDEPPFCYLCDVALSDTDGAKNKRSIEHVWPLGLGGETVAENLLLACSDCNSKRGDFATWVAGPVQSTRFIQSSNNKKTHIPSEPLRFSLGLARVLAAAQPTAKRREPMTLREASIEVRPIIPSVTVKPDRYYTFFELTDHLEVTL